MPTGVWGDDIGATGIIGNAATDYFGGNIFTTVEGAGADIWGASDSFYFVHQPFAPASNVVQFNAVNPFAKVGVMIRESLSANAPSVILEREA